MGAMLKWTLVSIAPNGESVYDTPHDTLTKVLVTFPVGYWAPRTPPQWILLRFEVEVTSNTWPGREPL